MKGARRGAAEIMLGTVVGQGLAILVSPILTRMYGPEAFAVLQVFTGVVSVGAVPASLRLELAIPIARDERETRSVLWAGVSSTIVVSALLWLAGLVTAGLWVGDDPTMQGLLRDWWLVPFTIAAIAVFQLVSAVLIRRQAYRDLAIRNVAQGVATVGAQLGFGALGLKPLGLLAGMSLGRAAGLLSTIRRRPSPRTCTNSEREPARIPSEKPSAQRGIRAGSRSGLRSGLGEMVAAVRRYKRFPLITTWAALFNNVGRYAPAFFFPLAYGAAPAGWIALVMRVFGVPVGIVGQAVGQVFLGKGAESQRENKGDLPRLTRYAVRQLTLIGIGPTILVMVLAPLVFGWIFGESFAESGAYAQILAPAFLAQFVASPVTNVFNILERQGVAFWLETVRLVGSIAVPLLVWTLGGTVMAAVAAYGCVLLLSYLAVLVMAWWVLR